MNHCYPYFQPLPQQREKKTSLFTYPFHYKADPMVCDVAYEVQQKLIQYSATKEFKELVEQKMFGVLIVEDQHHNIGYLTAISGINPYIETSIPIVPSIVSLEVKNGFYKHEEEYINRTNALVSQIENHSEKQYWEEELTSIKKSNQLFLQEAKKRQKDAKKERDAIRNKSIELPEEKQLELDKQLKQESQRVKKEYKNEKKKREEQEKEVEAKVVKYKELIASLKQIRKRQSQHLQQRIFKHYNLKNALGEQKDIVTIFQETIGENPPAGTGDCAAPKLLQFAYNHHLTPIAMGEFWWDSERQHAMRKHMQFYPSCKNKCYPILSFMLQGLDVENNPVTVEAQREYQLEYLFEDADLLIVNKPSGLLSVPGKEIGNSVYSIIKKHHPDFSGPLLVHRLDMSTSGILIVTKNLETYKKVQKQFLEKTIQKTYIALLDGEIHKNKGVISLPLRVDLDQRPLQMVCYEYGKESITHWEKIEVVNGKTRIALSPITGRTHQLRVHTAHKEGLNTPIIGDDLYGSNKEGRLRLHAHKITFIHPHTGKDIAIVCPCPF